ncbi:hypothetical protein [uncultured Sphingomonas sp.]|nr:hypothetical protein [uncultured Sphingomonas sp.]
MNHVLGFGAIYAKQAHGMAGIDAMGQHDPTGEIDQRRAIPVL